MIGLILCGGNSTRMQTDKGLLLQQGQYWAVVAHDKLAKLEIPVYFSIQASQQHNYSQILPSATLLTDRNDTTVEGPLKGLLTAHHYYPEEAVFLLACDLPDLPVALLTNLMKQYEDRQHPPAICYTRHHEKEPMCAIYHPSALSSLYTAALQDKLHRFSMKYILEQVGAVALELNETFHSFLKNYNSPEDLK